MIIDMHIHEKNGSLDSQLSIEEAIQEAEEKNIDGLCFTDHDSLYLRNHIEEYQQTTKVLLIVGVEIYTLDGDLLCYGLDELPKERMSAEETIAFVHKRGGVCIAAHPYRNNNRGLKDKILSLQHLDAIEVLNGRTLPLNNNIAYQKSKQNDLRQCGGSDAHQVGEVGKMGTYFNTDIRHELDFINAIKTGQFYPVALETRESIKIEKVI
ncbi:MAG TPA: PHP domain-containing protein [Clostridia bacterium]|nr:PHP domain-containing protein [Clostridia bacterium]